MRIFFRNDRRLLGKLCRLAYETIRDGLRQACRERVFDLLLREDKIDENVVRSMRAWPHSGFSIDNSVQITANDTEGMQRLVSYISCCPFSLARMIKVTETGPVIYRSVKSGCVRFPNPGDERLRQGVSRNFQVFEALEFLAEGTQHIPNKGQHLIRYFGWYSNKKRGVLKKKKAAAEGKQDIGSADANGFLKKRRMSWAALLKKVYEVDPLRCPACGGAMKIIRFIE